jgi:hypothetical protein
VASEISSFKVMKNVMKKVMKKCHKITRTLFFFFFKALPTTMYKQQYELLSLFVAKRSPLLLFPYKQCLGLWR